MEYKSYSTIIFSVNLFILAVFVALFIAKGGNWYMGIIPFGVITIGLLVFKIPIDRWGFRFQEVDIDDKVMGMIEAEYPQVARYTQAEKKEFRQRMFDFLYARDSYLVVGEPEKLDLYHTVLISTPGVIINMENKNPDKFEDIERVVAYKHAFPSPKMKFLHTAEYDSEDGVVIASLEHLQLCLKSPNEFYHIGFHIWATRYISKHEYFPSAPDDLFEKTERLVSVDINKIEQFLGYDSPDHEGGIETISTAPDKRVIALVSYFTNSENLRAQYPEYFKKIRTHLQTS